MAKITSLILLLILTSCTKKEEVIQSIGGKTQGTTYSILLWSHTEIDNVLISRSINKELKRIDSELSNYRTDSTIEKFNAYDDYSVHPITKELEYLISVANNVNRKSNGCFDLTIKGILQLWKSKLKNKQIPNDIEIKNELKHVGMHKIEVKDGRAVKLDKKTKLDLSGIAQGYTLGRLSEILEQFKIQNYLIEIGGEMIKKGIKPDGSKWRIGIQEPSPNSYNKPVSIISTNQDLAVMTSGSYRNFTEIAGKRYSHIIDPRLGTPVQHNTVSVTVLNKDPTLADAWSTALLCLGKEQGMEIAKKEHIAAYFITSNDAKFEEFTTIEYQNILHE